MTSHGPATSGGSHEGNLLSIARTQSPVPLPLPPPLPSSSSALPPSPAASDDSGFLPPPRPRFTRSSTGSSSFRSSERSFLLPGSGQSTPSAGGSFSRPASVFSLADDSRYPLPAFGHETHDFSRPASTYRDDEEGPPSPSPAIAGADELNYGEDWDDALHDPDDSKNQRGGISTRGLWNILTIVLIVLLILGVFAIYPLADYAVHNGARTAISNNVRVNSTGQIPKTPTAPKRPLIDPETPTAALTRIGHDQQQYNLVFSDEFNKPNRTFKPGDDPFWEAVDLWYGVTQDLEWYDPGQVTTGDGKLRIKLEKVDPKTNHNLDLKSGMLQSWNKFCFTGGYIEISAQLPGSVHTTGYWPGAWLMGNLARPGYPATTDGTWPYSYDTCDVGTRPNQTNGDGTPAAAYNVPAPYGQLGKNFDLSWLPGQRLSACTCTGEDHPGPIVQDDTGSRFKGRGAPEIDIIEAQICPGVRGGCASQSAQFAPFTAEYAPNMDGILIFNDPSTELNTFRGSPTQQAISALTNVSYADYASSGTGHFGTWGMEYAPEVTDPSSGYITWNSDGTPTWLMNGVSIGPDGPTEIGQRLIAQEPMSIVFNLAVSHTFGTFDVDQLTFPAEFLIDYVRVYQRDGSPASAASCDPPDYPTAAYIKKHEAAYTDTQVTSWKMAGYTQPKSSKIEGCTAS
ncbi:beta-glucan synthesis-associated [Exidia glandulosa HHB12029]|uniref:Beta-glucan synthesis-associated n=1 Tax=Exidia glandulosa HHB12029 TaxID=1314781 RepID=A0A165EIM9_EXIGL|nr:beta-glucan synthesis-associated [Exidia glandulosa HHB12029]